MIRKLSRILGIVLLSIYLYLAYHLLVIPGALDFSYYGILGFIVASVLAIVVLPKGLRIRAALLSIGILVLSRGFANVLNVSLFLQVVSFCIITVVAGLLLRLYAKVRWNTTVIAAITILVLTYAMPIRLLPFLSHFNLEYQTGNLVDPMTSVYPAFPIDVIIGSNNSGDQVITESNRPNRWISGQQLDSKRDTMPMSLDLNSSSPSLHLLKANQLPNSMFSDFGTIGFPYDTYTLYNVKGYVQQEFRTLHQPQEILQNALDLGSLPALQTSMELNTLHEDQLAWDVFQTSQNNTQQASIAQANLNTDNAKLQIQNHEITGLYNGKPLTIATDDTKLLGVGHLLAGTSEQLVTEGNNRLDVYDVTNGALLATYQSKVDIPLPNSLVIGDVDHDGQDELLINTIPARILKLSPNHQWQTLWVSPKDSFRFETVGKIGNDLNVSIVTNSPSEVRDVDTRYLTGYTYSNGTLIRQWRVPRGSLIFPELVKKQNSNVNELLATDYGTQNMYILGENNTPIQFCLIVLYGVYLVGALIYRGFRKGGRANV